MPATISNFYTTLFALEITAFGIILAALLVFIQLIHSSFSHIQVKYMFHGRLFWGWLIIGFICLLLTGINGLCLSFGYGQDWMLCIYMGAVCLGLFLLSIVILPGLIIYNNIKYLHPNFILGLSKKAITFNGLSYFLLNKYGVAEPSVINIKAIMSKLGQKELSDEDKIEYENTKAKADEEYRKIQERLKMEKKAIESCSDSLTSIKIIATRAINNFDINTLSGVKDIYLRIEQDFIDNYKINCPKLGNSWNPDTDLIADFAYYMVETIEHQFDLCQQHKFNPGQSAFLELSESCTNIAVDNDAYKIVIEMLKLWKKISDQSIGSNPDVFNYLMGLYSKLLKRQFNLSNQGILDAIFKDLGWIGERLLTKKPVIEKAITPNYEFATEHDVYFNCILNISDTYIEQFPHLYLLSYFGMMQVILIQFTKVLKKSANDQMERYAYDLLYFYYSFLRQALKVGNINGVRLAWIELKLRYDYFESEDIEILTKYAIGLFAKFGAAISGNKEIEDFSGNKLYAAIIATLARIKSKYRETITLEIQEIYRRSIPGDHKNIWNFIIDLGKKMKTNFGFMFDWETGKVYADDDPRRNRQTE